MDNKPWPWAKFVVFTDRRFWPFRDGQQAWEMTKILLLVSEVSLQSCRIEFSHDKYYSDVQTKLHKPIVHCRWGMIKQMLFMACNVLRLSDISLWRVEERNCGGFRWKMAGVWNEWTLPRKQPTTLAYTSSKLNSAHENDEEDMARVINRSVKVYSTMNH